MKVEAESEKSVVVTLMMDEAAATWLKQQMQNPLHNEMPEEESELDRKYRSEFWMALGEIG